MYCLYCGDCCKRMSPISNPEPCPHMFADGTFCFCSRYSNRPKECREHEYQSRFCPIGLSILRLGQDADTTRIHKRIDDGWALVSP